MPTNRKHRVPRSERWNPSKKQTLDWEGARIFLEITRAGSFRAAAEKLDQSFNTLRRRFDKLQRGLGVTLLTRHVDGVRLTAEGARVLIAAQRMEAASFELVRDQSLEQSALKGEVKLATTEGLAAYWIGSAFAEYRDRHPEITLNVFCTMSPPDILRLEADIAVQLVRPSAKYLKVKKLGRLHFMPFASKDYVDAHGVPKSLADLIGHRLVMQEADPVPLTASQPMPIQAALGSSAVAIRSNSSAVTYTSIVNGAGIGMLPTYVCQLPPYLVPINLNYRTQHDIWLVYHPDAGRIARVQQTIEWLISIFSPRKYPWFDDKFILPEDLPTAAYRSRLLTR